MGNFFKKIDNALDRIIAWFIGKKTGLTPNKDSQVAQQSSNSNLIFSPKKASVDNLANPPINSLSIILTQKCNLKCDYCLRNTNSELKDDPEIPFNTLEQLVILAHRIGCRGCGLTGGEFFLYSKWRQLIALIGAWKWGTLIETNGILISRNPGFLDYLIEHLNSRFQVLISLDSYEERKHDLHRGKNSFRQALKAIKLVKSRGIELHTNIILTPANFMSEKELVNYVKFVKNLGVDVANIGRVVSVGRGTNSKLMLSIHQSNKIYEILKKHDFFNGYVRWGFFNNLDETNGCNRIGRNICISPYGIHPCVFHQEIKMGDFEDFEKIVWSNFFQSLNMFRRGARVGLLRPRFNCGECVNCLPQYLKWIKKTEVAIY